MTWCGIPEHLMNPIDQAQQEMSRRLLFQKVGFGIGSVALGELLGKAAMATSIDPDPDQSTGTAPYVKPKAKHVIYIHLVGAPSHLDLFDPKPELTKRSGEPCPLEFFEGKPFAFIREHPNLLGTPSGPSFKFRRSGESGLELSNLLPHLQGVADDLCVIRTIQTDQFNHAPAQLKMLTGFERFGRPCLGSWLSYGLGTENSDLPSFVVLITGQILGAGNSAWGSGFLPTVHQGVEFRSQGDPVLFLSNPPGVDRTLRREMVDSINQLNQYALADVGDPEIETRINQYELAFRMQSSVPELMDISDEPKEVHELYGTSAKKASFANNCLLARRLIERGVRFVQLFDQGWDMHSGVFKNLPKKAASVDRPLAALIQDLKRRGLLEETLVVWSAEFGRTPMAQATNSQRAPFAVGRDHHRDAFSVWIAGGGSRDGTAVGLTDPLGFSAVDNPVHVHDFNATLLHLLGIDHTRLTFRYQGREFRLTDVHGRVIPEIVA